MRREASKAKAINRAPARIWRGLVAQAVERAQASGERCPTYWPAALRLDQAAAYVGLSVDTFKEVSPVKPIAFTPSTRGIAICAQPGQLLVSLDLMGRIPPRRNGGLGRRSVLK